MQKYLSSLTALHSAEEQVAGSIAAGRPVRRDAIVTEHPLIRTNPVTGWNSLYYNPGFVTSIKGVPKLESDAIKAYLDQVIVSTVELQARYHLRRGSIAFWDNRTCVSSFLAVSLFLVKEDEGYSRLTRETGLQNHTASFGFMPHRRHAVRVTPHGERPRFDPNGKSQEEELLTKMGMPLVNKDGAAAQSNYND